MLTWIVVLGAGTTLALAAASFAQYRRNTAALRTAAHSALSGFADVHSVMSDLSEMLADATTVRREKNPSGGGLVRQSAPSVVLEPNTRQYGTDQIEASWDSFLLKCHGIIAHKTQIRATLTLCQAALRQSSIDAESLIQMSPLNFRSVTRELAVAFSASSADERMLLWEVLEDIAASSPENDQDHTTYVLLGAYLSAREPSDGPVSRFDVYSRERLDLEFWCRPELERPLKSSANPRSAAPLPGGAKLPTTPGVPLYGAPLRDESLEAERRSRSARLSRELAAQRRWQRLARYAVAAERRHATKASQTLAAR